METPEIRGYFYEFLEEMKKITVSLTNENHKNSKSKLLLHSI